MEYHLPWALNVVKTENQLKKKSKNSHVRAPLLTSVVLVSDQPYFTLPTLKKNLVFPRRPYLEATKVKKKAQDQVLLR